MRNFAHLNQVRTTTDQMPALVFQHLICGGVQQDFEKFVNAGKRTRDLLVFHLFPQPFCSKNNGCLKGSIFCAKNFLSVHCIIRK
jgi:hypothetical protein